MLRTLALPVLALATCQYAAALNLVPTPPKQPPKFEGSASSRRRVMGASSVMPTGHSMQKTPPLQAYTISEPNKKNDWWMPKWEDFLPKSAESAGHDSLYSLEGGLAIPAKKPLMPNLEIENSLTVVDDDDSASELAVLKMQFESIKKQNDVLESALQKLTTTVEKQSALIMKLQLGKSSDLTEGANKILEDDNGILRRRIRALEGELSDVAFETRKSMSKPDVAEPKAPSTPPSGFQSVCIDQLQDQIRQYELERSSVRRLFGLGVMRAAGKVGQAVSLFNPARNLKSWGNMWA